MTERHIKYLIPPILTESPLREILLMLGCALRCDAVFYPPLHHRQKSFSAYTNPFIRRTSICCEVGHAMPDQGGMKGPNGAR